MSKKIQLASYLPSEENREPERGEGKVFYENLKLILEKTDIILNKKEYFYCQPHFAWMSVILCSEGPIPLGCLILLWKEGRMIEKCPDCGDKVYINSISGSLVSGRNKWCGGCIHCLQWKSGDGDSRLFDANLRAIVEKLNQYPNEPIIEKGKEPVFDWKQGLKGEYIPDKVIKEAIKGIDLISLIEKLKQLDLH